MKNKDIKKNNSSVLFRNNRDFRYFEGIKPDSSKKIDSITRVFYDRLSSMQVAYDLKNESLYEKASRFLSSNFYLTYDEKIIFLIRLLDPTLKLLTAYDKIVNENPDDSISTPIVKGNVLFSVTKENEEKIASISRGLLGFYEPLFVKYEYLYREKVLNVRPEDKTTNLRMNYTKYVSQNIKLSDISLKTSIDEVDQIIEEASVYLMLYPRPSLNDLIFQLLCESGRLSYSRLRNRLIFIIFVLDKDLRYKTVYDENFNLVTISRKISALFGCYYQFLMELENKFVSDNSDCLFCGTEIKKPTYR